MRDHYGKWASKECHSATGLRQDAIIKCDTTARMPSEGIWSLLFPFYPSLLSFPFTVATGTDGTGATNGSSSRALLLRRRGTPRPPARSAFPRPANPPQPRAPPRPPALRELPHARLAKLRLRGLHAMAGSSSPWRGSSASTPAMDHTTATTPTRTNKYTIPRSRRISNNEIPLIHCPDCMCRFLKVCTSKTEKNYDRQFYVCPTRTVRMVSCKFFM